MIFRTSYLLEVLCREGWSWPASLKNGMSHSRACAVAIAAGRFGAVTIDPCVGPIYRGR